MTKFAKQLIEKERETRSGYLDLGCCGLTEMPDLSDMYWLETLILSNKWWDWEQQEWFNSQNGGQRNHLKTLQSGDFPTGLTKLVLGGISSDIWKIKDLRFLANLSNLQTLNLGFNEIRDGVFLGNLTNLQILDLRSNIISDGTFLKDLTNLKTLYISNNKIRNGKFFENLTNLQTLDLSYNQLSDVAFLEKLLKLKTLDIYNNPLVNPPGHIVNQGSQAILEYFHQKAKTGAVPLLEAKLILLGDGRAGKTSLANRLLGKPLPKEKDRTMGVDIVIGEYNFEVKEGVFKLHIWDFAGQDKYKPLHQFFYTEGAVYVMVADSGNAGTDYDDWLQTAQLFGAASPLLIALNEFREGMGYGVFDEDHWKKRFPKLLKEVHLVNLLTEKGVDALEMDIRLFSQRLLHTAQEYPKNWATIRQELERLRDKNFITWSEYISICQHNDLPERESALILSGILHKIGVCLHYQNSPLLKQYVILKNEWATDAVYRVLEDRIVAEEKKGFFDWGDLNRIWSDETYRDMCPQLLELMQHFKLAYPLPNKKEYVTPPLLPPAPPLGWEMSVDESLHLLIEYEFLPKALITQFIVQRHTDIDRERTLVWRNGVVLRWPDALAEVVKTKSQGRDAFSVLVQGRGSKPLLTSILKTFRDLHAEYNGIRASEIVPCHCSGCQTGKNKQHFFDLENLKNRFEKGRKVVECDKSLEDVALLQLLGDLLVFERLKVGEPLVLKSLSRVRSTIGTKGHADTILHEHPEKLPPLAFFSYSKHDTEYLTEFRKYLRTLERTNKIRLWDDRDIRPGEEWDNTIKQNLAESSIIFLLVSVDFLNTEYVWETEITEAMRRHETGEAKVIPIKIRQCDWSGTPFSTLQGLPRKDTIIGENSKNDAVWTEVVTEIGKMISTQSTASKPYKNDK
jgi:internalin A